MAKQKIKKSVKINEPIKRLYRSKEDKVIAGVCGGIAEYFEIDPVWVRLIGIVSVFLNGVGVLAYIILWILVPENPKQTNNKKTVVQEKVSEFQETIKTHNKDSHIVKKKERSSHIVIGGILIILGMLFLLKNTFGWINTQIFWSFLIIGLGVLLLLRK